MDTNLNVLYSGGVPVAGILQEVSLIAQGDTETSREGLKIQSIGTKLDMNIVFGDSYNKLRVCMFVWNDDTAPTATSIFAGGYSTYVQTPWAWPLNPKMRIIFDKKILVTNTTNSSYYLRRYVRHNRVTEFTGSASNSGIKGRVYLFAASDSTAPSHPTITGYARYLFKEL